MTRFLFKLIICLLLAGGAGLTYFAFRSGDPIYTLHEWVSPARFQQYDGLIRNVAMRHNIDPMLVKAVIWRESRFDPQKFGTAGERGLMQVSEGAAKEWASQNQLDNFRVEDLFDPRKNLEAGSWYLQRALQHWQHQPEPIPFALAEYNAGASRAQRWAGGEGAAAISAKVFRRNIDFPGTRKYVESGRKSGRFEGRRDTRKDSRDWQSHCGENQGIGGNRFAEIL
jgi:soluble lytic murein transglycosylase